MIRFGLPPDTPPTLAKLIKRADRLSAWFEATQTGIYRGQCTELCGRGHGFMPIVVVVETQERYEQWLAGELKWDAVEQQLVAARNEQSEGQAETLAAL